MSRVYLLGADLEQDRAGWVADFERVSLRACMHCVPG